MIRKSIWKSKYSKDHASAQWIIANDVAVDATAT